MKIKYCSLRKKKQNNFNFTLLLKDERKYQWLFLVTDFDKTEPTLTLENYCINFISALVCLYAKGCNGASMHQ